MQVFVVEEGMYEDRDIWGIYPTLEEAQAQFPDYEWVLTRAGVWNARFTPRPNFQTSPPVAISCWDVGEEE